MNKKLSSKWVQEDSRLWRTRLLSELQHEIILSSGVLGFAFGLIQAIVIVALIKLTGNYLIVLITSAPLGLIFGALLLRILEKYSSFMFESVKSLIVVNNTIDNVKEKIK